MYLFCTGKYVFAVILLPKADQQHMEWSCCSHACYSDLQHDALPYNVYLISPTALLRGHIIFHVTVIMIRVSKYGCYD